jgi:hypothetical protein
MIEPGSTRSTIIAIPLQELVLSAEHRPHILSSRPSVAIENHQADGDRGTEAAAVLDVWRMDIG